MDKPRRKRSPTEQFATTGAYHVLTVDDPNVKDVSTENAVSEGGRKSAEMEIVIEGGESSEQERRFIKAQKEYLNKFEDEASKIAGDDNIIFEGLKNLKKLSEEVSAPEDDKFLNLTRPMNLDFYNTVKNQIAQHATPENKEKETAQYYLLSLVDNEFDYKTIFEKYNKFDKIGAINIINDVKFISQYPAKYPWMRPCLKNFFRIGQKAFDYYVGKLVADKSAGLLFRQRMVQLLANAEVAEVAAKCDDENTKAFDKYYDKISEKIIKELSEEKLAEEAKHELLSKEKAKEKIKKRSQQLEIIKQEKLRVMARKSEVILDVDGNEVNVSIEDIVEMGLLNAWELGPEIFDKIVSDIRERSKEHTYIVSILYRILLRGPEYYLSVVPIMFKDENSYLKIEDLLDEKYKDDVDAMIADFLKKPKDKLTLLDIKRIRDQQINSSMLLRLNRPKSKPAIKIKKQKDEGKSDKKNLEHEMEELFGFKIGDKLKLKEKEGIDSSAIYIVKKFMCRLRNIDGKPLTEDQKLRNYYMELEESTAGMTDQKRKDMQKKYDFFIQVPLLSVRDIYEKIT